MRKISIPSLVTIIASMLLAMFASATLADDSPLVYQGTDGPGLGKHIVLIAGDEEYRSEEALPQLAKILALRHGFRCTVLFSMDRERGIIQPNVTGDIPGLEALESADLMIIFTRFRNLKHEQMQQIDDYLRSGRPVIGIRTATHAFKINGGPWARYSNGYHGDETEWTDGFGRLVLGEKWVAHHGSHRHQSTRGRIVPGAKDHPIARGLTDENIWGPSDVYRVRLPLPHDLKPIVLGEVINRAGEYDDTDPYYGMKPTDSEGDASKNDPMMPIAWCGNYKIPGGEQGRVFASTIGAANDMTSEGVRRLLVNAAYWCTSLEDSIPKCGTEVDMVGEYKPGGFGFRSNDYWIERNLKIDDLRLAK